MIDYIIGYLVIGAVSLLITYAITHLDNSEEAKDLREMRKRIEPKSKNFKEQIINQLIVPIIALILALIFWPAALIWVIKDRLERRAYKNREEKEPEIFKVKKGHLKEKVSIEDVEALETVMDPLDAAPKIPFGHLNSAWQELKKNINQKMSYGHFLPNGFLSGDMLINEQVMLLLNQRYLLIFLLQ